MFEPKHLKPWTMPECYVGAVWPATYGAGVGQSRDSDAMERVNFAYVLKALGGESDTVTVVRESHWAVGWVEWIAIHQDDEKALRIADELAGQLLDYPSLDDDAVSELEWNEAADYWDGMSPRDRVRYAMDVRKRYHWLAKVPVWMLGRATYGDLGEYDHGDLGTIVRAIEESLRD